MLNLNIDEIDFQNIGAWPSYLKVAIIATSCFMLFAICHWLFISGKIERLDNLKDEQARQKQFFINKNKLLINIKDYKKQLSIVEQRLSNIIKKLPSDNELPSLISEISQYGHDSGLEFKEIKILSEKKFSYYVELPIKIKVNGNYHQLSDFISKVSGMPRVITFHNFDLTIMNNEKYSNDQNLDLEILAKTYRYLVNTDKENDRDEKSKRI